MDYNDEQLLSLALENNETAHDMLYEKYSYIVDILLKKYRTQAQKLGIDMKELEQEAYFAFSNALKNYRYDKNSQLSTFISLCINRRLSKIIKSQSGEKAKLLNNVYSLDYDYNEDQTPRTLNDFVSDDFKFDPLSNLEENENYTELITNIKEYLSPSEYEIFTYLVNNLDYLAIAKITKRNPKQIDNAIQRVKNKIKDIIKSLN